MEFNTNSGLNLGTNQLWLLPTILDEAYADDTNVISIYVEVTGENYYIYDNGQNAMLSSPPTSYQIPIDPQADMNALALTMTYIGGIYPPKVDFTVKAT